MSLLKMKNEFSSDLFTWNKNTGTVEISDLGKDYWFEQVYDDALDVGLKIRSSKTGKVATFVLYKVDKDREDEVQGWWLQGVERAYKHVFILVIND